MKKQQTELVRKIRDEKTIGKELKLIASKDSMDATDRTRKALLEEQLKFVQEKEKEKVVKLKVKHGKYEHPEKSVYYHPVMNPFGAPPPGMPERFYDDGSIYTLLSYVHYYM